MSVLILAEHDGRHLHPAVNHAVTAAQFWGLPVHLLVAGSDTAEVASAVSKISGIARVIRADAAHLEHPLAEDMANIIAAIGRDYRIILSVHGSFSRNILPRAAALLDVGMVSDAVEIVSENTYVRPVYAGSVYSTVQTSDAIQIVTVRSSRFKAAGAGGSADIASVDVPPPFGKSRWLGKTHIHSDRPVLGTARIVVSGGRSLGSAEKFEAVLSPLAEKLEAALGATRAAVDAGYAPNDIQVGQTGVVVAPDLYIAVGVSGAVQHTYGMKDSKIVVAINQDPDAPIFQVADYGLVADLFEAVPALTAAIQ